jgi:hypothetical protein
LDDAAWRPTSFILCVKQKADRLVPWSAMEMNDLNFEVLGSNGAIYELSFVTRDGVTAFLCSCEAGRCGIHCKHRINLVEGDTSAVLSENPRDIALLVHAIGDTPIGVALETLRLAERQQETAKKKVTAAKKTLAAALMGKP